MKNYLFYLCFAFFFITLYSCQSESESTGTSMEEKPGFALTEEPDSATAIDTAINEIKAVSEELDQGVEELDQKTKEVEASIDELLKDI